jgi:hypothetical protein
VRVPKGSSETIVRVFGLTPAAKNDGVGAGSQFRNG